MTSVLIEAQNLSKDFPAVHAVQDVSFRVRAGEAIGFLGPNGAGKTTTFRMLAGTLGPSRGRVLVRGHDLREKPVLAKRLIGYMPEVTPLYPEMTAREYLSYRCALRAISRKERGASVANAAEQAKAQDHLGTRIGHLSKGYRRRVALADALLGDPPVLLLDEPTAGLDPNQVLDFRHLIRELAKDRAILISTHVLSEIEATCSRAIVIHRGRLVAEGTLSELQARRASKKARLVVGAPLSELRACLKDLLPLAEFEACPEGSVCFFAFDEETLIPRSIERCVEAGLPVHAAGPVRAALDDVFALLTRSDELAPKREP